MDGFLEAVSWAGAISISSTIAPLIPASIIRISGRQLTPTVPARRVWIYRSPSSRRISSSNKTRRRWRRCARFLWSITRPAHLRWSLIRHSAKWWPTIIGWISDPAARLHDQSLPASAAPFSLTAAPAPTIRPDCHTSTSSCSSRQPPSKRRCPDWKRISERRDATWAGCRRIWRPFKAPPEAFPTRSSRCSRRWPTWSDRSTEPSRLAGNK